MNNQPQNKDDEIVFWRPFASRALDDYHRLEYTNPPIAEWRLTEYLKIRKLIAGLEIPTPKSKKVRSK